ncbi:threonine-phosphate decarboxylase [Sutcliffiella horikoshii]|uniref:threonine-phosphate decarboxylase n=1 Tax=Sutcliffiella horikoshii TaxID=79883 RepID=A0A5D4T446_9BACI|nr:threonine-phosphate decarboxylase CobD [Sutcliffiella horikoshii]TYS70470.1 threonine-phosphate decarboxylase [Sutcliffiella horikoshii]
MNWPEHGGQPDLMKKLLHAEELEVLDFSANLNPLGPPEWLQGELEAQWKNLLSYPDPNYSISNSALARMEKIRDEEILLTNGGAEAIFLAAKYFEGKRAGIVHPAFSEYERACRHYHLKVTDILTSPEEDFRLPMNQLLESLPNLDVLFLCRPNNPAGVVIPKGEIKMLLEQGLHQQTFLVIDEAFVDFVPSESLTPLLQEYPNLILLRSLTKMYTIPGLRLGYMMAREAVINEMKNFQVPWSVNALASAVAPLLLRDKSYSAHTVCWLEEQTKKLQTFAQNNDFYLSNTSVNFYLLQDNRQRERTEALFTFLFQHGILARHTYNFKGLEGSHLRLAIRSEEENAKLLTILKKWREKV